MDSAAAEIALRDLIRADRLPEALALGREILADQPENHDVLHQLGLIHIRQGRFSEAVELIQRAIAYRGDIAAYHFNLGQPLLALGQAREAELAWKRAIGLDPSIASAHMNLGAALFQQGKLNEAEIAFRRAIELRPGDAGLYVNLGGVCRLQNRLDEAVRWYQRAIAIDPNRAAAYNALGSALRESGEIGSAIASFKKAVQLQPGYRVAHSNLVYAMHFDPDTTPEENFAEHLRWSGKFADPLGAAISPHGNSREPKRRLRIGYVSPDLRNHPVGLFMEPILQRHDRREFEVFCYADVRGNDELTQRLRSHTDVWRDTAGLGDEQLAQLIRNDGIDILVDLTLHMQHNRLMVFARRPAPVQIAHLAYCATSGMSAMDWCITDRHMSPPGVYERYFTEKLLRVGESYWCYVVPANGPAVGPLPAKANGFVTFGCLNSPAKVNDRVIELWSKVMAAAANSRLLIHATSDSVRERFIKAGISADRISIHSYLPRDEYLNLYNQIDIALDPFPFGGGTTSLDALWMGVPLVTLAGQSPLSRTGVTLLTQIGELDLIAPDSEQYVRIALDLADDLQRLAELRGGLRERVTRSSLMDAARYTRDLERAYRMAWRQWCISEA